MRQTKEVTIKAEGRDHGKTFILTEMPAYEGELWATRALELLEQSGQFKAQGSGAAGLAGAVAARDGIQIARLLQDSSLDGMWKHVQFQPSNRDVPPQPLREDHIEEWRTLLDLRVAYFRLLTGFFSPENPSISGQHSPPSSS